MAAGLGHGLTALWAGPRPSLLARLLQPLSWVYAGLARLHKAAYSNGLLQRQRAPLPLLVVGNLVAGGAGKTPTVIALVGLLRQQGWTPGVISRGHGRRGRGVMTVQRSSNAAEVGDEPLLIHLRTGAPVAVGADRGAAARALCAAHPALDILLADDGLQHHRLRHDMAVLVFDERGAGNGLRLPAGPLREALPAHLPPRTLVLYNAAQASTALPGLTGQRRLAGVQPLADWWAGLAVDATRGIANSSIANSTISDGSISSRTISNSTISSRTNSSSTETSSTETRPTDASSTDKGWAALRGRPLLAAAGLARPEPFFAMLEAQGLHIRRLPLADHQAFNPLPWPADTAELIVTEKDAVKLPPAAVGSTRVWVAGLDFLPEPAFAAALRTLCAPFKPKHPQAHAKTRPNTAC